MLQATVTQGEHIIRLQPALYRLTITGAGEDQGRTGDLDVRGNITIIGTTSGGRLRSTVDATGLNDRVFDVRQGATATLQGLTVSGGAPPPDGVLFRGAVRRWRPNPRNGIDAAR